MEERTPVATLMIRDLDEDVKARLRVQAAEHGRSMEAEARAILAAALTGRRPPRGLGRYIVDQVVGARGLEIEIAPRNEPARTTRFDR
jgi:plasmid stability protein